MDSFSALQEHSWDGKWLKLGEQNGQKGGGFGLDPGFVLQNLVR